MERTLADLLKDENEDEYDKVGVNILIYDTVCPGSSDPT